MIKMISAKILADEDILSEEPILWKLCDINMETPLFPLNRVRDFNKIAGVLAEYFLINSKERLSTENKEILEHIYNNDPILRIYDDFGLPYFIILVSKPTNIREAISIYNKWCVGKATRLGYIDEYTIENIIKGQEQHILNIALTDYFMHNANEDELIDLFKQISYRQQNIKKKLVNRLMEKEIATVDLPRSSHNAKILEFRRKKQQRLSHS